VPYSPGKPIEEVKRELGLDHVIKLASNENPLGPSPLALEALSQAAQRLNLYPDAASYDLRQALSAHLGVPADWIVCGNGSDEIIHLLGLAFLDAGDELIQGDPSFVRYEASAILNSADCVLVPLRDWVHDLDAMLAQVSSRTRLIYIANPNNPTGTIVPRSEVEHFLDRLPDHVVVVFDEAYFEYVDDPDYPNMLEAVRQDRNVVVLRTFSKAYGLAGLRIGYGIMRPEIAKYLDKVREPFNVNLLAHAAAIAALGDTDHLAKTRAANQAGLSRMYAAFDKLDLPYTRSQGNFVWFDVKRDSREVFQALLRKGVITRTGDVFGAPTHLRVTTGTPDQVTEFITQLEAVLI
jgi:histidinol-phosphate aminotransferase